MDLLLDYQKDRNNGMSIVNNFTYQVGKSWGEPCMADRWLSVPLSIGTENDWKIFVYKYDTDVDNWVFYQIIDVPLTCDGTFIRTAVTGNSTSSILVVLNNDLHKAHFYRLNDFEQWVIIQTIDVPYEIGVNPYSGRVSAYGNYVAISDWAKVDGPSTGVVWIYMWHSATNEFVLVKTQGNPGSNTDRFGEGLSIRDGTLFVGAPYYDGLSGDNDGRVYIYTGSGSAWIYKESLYGENCINGYFGWFLSAYMDAGTNRLLVGARGYNNAKGRVYFYHRSVGGDWGLPPNPVSIVDAPIAYQANDNQFGSIVSIWNDQACVVAGNELINQGAIYIYKWTGAIWEIDVLMGTADPARFTQAGATDYGLFACITPQTVFTMIQYGNGLFISRAATGWTQRTFMFIDNIYLKTTVDESFYHLASGNQTIVFKLTSPISGNFRVILEVDNELETIGPQNDKIYFVENGVYKVAELTHGTYTGATLATHVQDRMNAISISGTYVFTYKPATKKFVAESQVPFAFGSNLPTSLVDSCQNKTMGFYDNNNSIVHILYASDAEAQLTYPTQIGVKIIEGYPVIPVRNNSVFAEVGLIATLDTVSNTYKISTIDNQIIKFPKKVSSLSFVFPCLDGGALLNINTNNIKVRLTHTN